MSRVIFMAHPYSGKPSNLIIAKLWRQWIQDRTGAIVLAPWIHDIEVGGETLRTRNVGIARNRQLIERCDELWLVGDVISPGMQQEKEHAEALGVEIVTCIGSVYPDDSLCVEDENDPVIPFW